MMVLRKVPVPVFGVFSRTTNGREVQASPLMVRVQERSNTSKQPSAVLLGVVESLRLMHAFVFPWAVSFMLATVKY